LLLPTQAASDLFLRYMQVPGTRIIDGSGNKVPPVEATPAAPAAAAPAIAAPALAEEPVGPLKPKVCIPHLA